MSALGQRKVPDAGKEPFSRLRKRGRHHWQQRAGRHKGKQRGRDRGGAFGPLVPVRASLVFFIVLASNLLYAAPGPLHGRQGLLWENDDSVTFFCPALQKRLSPEPLPNTHCPQTHWDDPVGKIPAPGPGPLFSCRTFRPCARLCERPFRGLCRSFPRALRAPLVLPWPRAFRGFVHGSRAFWFGPWVLAELPVRLPLQKPCSRAGARTSPARYQGRARRKARIPRGTGTCPTS